MVSNGRSPYISYQTELLCALIGSEYELFVLVMQPDREQPAVEESRGGEEQGDGGAVRSPARETQDYCGEHLLHLLIVDLSLKPDQSLRPR